MLKLKKQKTKNKEIGFFHWECLLRFGTEKIETLFRMNINSKKALFRTNINYKKKQQNTRKNERNCLTYKQINLKNPKKLCTY